MNERLILWWCACITNKLLRLRSALQSPFRSDIFPARSCFTQLGKVGCTHSGKTGLTRIAEQALMCQHLGSMVRAASLTHPWWRTLACFLLDESLRENYFRFQSHRPPVSLEALAPSMRNTDLLPSNHGMPASVTLHILAGSQRNAVCSTYKTKWVFYSCARLWKEFNTWALLIVGWLEVAWMLNETKTLNVGNKK